MFFYTEEAQNLSELIGNWQTSREKGCRDQTDEK